MPKKDKLFELIKTMSMSEKRYFKLFAGRHTIGEQNNYVRLFDVLDQMNGFNAGELVTAAEKAGLPTKHLSSDKSYLYNLVLKSLSACNAGKSSSLQVKEFLHQAEILLERGLHDHALRVLKKALTIAQKANLIWLVPEVYYQQYLALQGKANLQAPSELLQKIEPGLQESSYLFQLQQLWQQAIGYLRNYGEVRTPEEKRELELFLEHPLLHRPASPDNFHASLSSLQVKATAMRVLGNTELELALVREARQLFENQEEFKKEYPLLYAQSLGSLLYLEGTDNDNDFEANLSAYRSLPDHMTKAHVRVKSQVYLLSYHAEMYRLIHQKRFEDALHLIPAMESIFDTFRESTTDYMQTDYFLLFAFVYFANKEYSKALQQINSILNEMPLGDFLFLSHKVRILDLMTHYELGNYQLLRYKADSTWRFFKKEQRDLPPEQTFIKLVRRLAQHPPMDETRKLFKQAREQWTEQAKDPLTNRFFMDLPIWPWVNSHL
ncbi:MAG: hypothetical protein AAGI38_13710 [Bacteroidota bacterium]